MKKVLIAGLIGLVMAPSLSFAQVVDPVKEDVASVLRAQIEQLTIQILLMQIADLQRQIAEILAQQETERLGSSPDVFDTPAFKEAEDAKKLEQQEQDRIHGCVFSSVKRRGASPANCYR